MVLATYLECYTAMCMGLRAFEVCSLGAAPERASEAKLTVNHSEPTNG